METDTRPTLEDVPVSTLLARLDACEAELRRHRMMINETGKQVRDLAALPMVELDESDAELWNFAVDAAVAAFGVPREAILGRCRQYRFSIPRHTARYLLYRVAKWSSPRVGRVARCDHSVVQYSANAVESLKLDAHHLAKITEAETIFKGGLNA